MDADDQPTAAEVTIDELAAEVGMTVRNIRAHQSRGLVPPPRIVGRIGYYGNPHRARVRQIQRLQEEGLNLAAIARVVADGRLTAAATEPFTDAAPVDAPAGALAARLGLDPDDPGIARAAALGLVTPEGDGVRIEHPRLIDVAEQLAAQGVPLDAMLDAVVEIQAASDRVARA
ncbi:MAG TPA: MerR family transcriptional regulator, partial [Aquihabitans sp.]|nr:MerR family transcriptional regulator [Aquihabitans sp.]